MLSYSPRDPCRNNCVPPAAVPRSRVAGESSGNPEGTRRGANSREGKKKTTGVRCRLPKTAAGLHAQCVSAQRVVDDSSGGIGLKSKQSDLRTRT